MSGTSQAAAHVSAVAAMVIAAMSKNPVDVALTPVARVAKVRSYLQASATDLGTAGKDASFGYGLVNACGAIMAGFGQQANLSAPVLHLSSETVDFDKLGKSHTVILSAGCGHFPLQGIEVETPAVATWLSVSLSGGAQPTLTVTVDRKDLAEADYTSTITVKTTNGGTKTISVKMSVGATSAGADTPDAIDNLISQVDDFLSDRPGYDNTSDIGEMVIVLVDANNPCRPLDDPNPNCVQTKTDMSANYNFYFSNGVPVGEFYLMGGTDDNQNGKICEPGEFCIIYPNPTAPEIITVTSTTKRNDLIITY
jgi:serine protease